jgi:hypothetical protein
VAVAVPAQTFDSGRSGSSDAYKMWLKAERRSTVKLISFTEFFNAGTEQH